MKTRLLTKAVFIAAALCSAPLYAVSVSYYPIRLNDPAAVYATKQEFAVHGDGIADDSAGIQKAIDKVADTTKQGIVFLPSGRYRITKTIYIWPGVRVIGYGSTRPVLVLGKDTPGFQSGIAYMVFFAGARHPYRSRGPFPGTVPPTDVEDANPGTFYSAMSNVDFEIEEGNPGAVGIRFHVAQHCFLTHMNFHVGSGLAALHDIGNEAEDLHFYGGQYGIMTEAPSPGWQFTLLDSTFQGQHIAAIKEHEAGLTLDGDTFRDVPTAISIDPGYPDELWVKNSRFENISGPAVIVSNENNPRTEINLRSIVCSRVPMFAQFRESGKQVRGLAQRYRVDSFSHGLTIAGLGAPAKIITFFHAVPLATLPPAGSPVIRNLPPRNTWMDLRDLGAKGDGVADDTAAIQKAIDEHATIYVPSGRYRVSDTIRLRPDTVLIGLHPSTTEFFLADSTPGFQGPGNPKPLLKAPKGGTNILTGIGIYTNGINSRAAGVMWMAGKDSLMDDVRFLGGHGTNRADGTRINPYNNTHTADPDIRRKWDAQYPSLWVTNGGGGTFADIWTPDTFAQAGMLISNTSTPGHIFELSSEHHVRNEVVLRHVSNWEINALQTEEEWGEGPFALPLEIDDSRNITVANFHSYRVIASYQPFPYAVRVARSSDIRFWNLHVNSNSKVAFDNSVFDQTYNVQVRQNELTGLTISGGKPIARPTRHLAVLAPGAKVQKLCGGFFSISGATVDKEGRLYFIDTHWQRIYRWSPETGDLKIIRDNSLQPTELAFDKAGNLMVVSYAGKGTVYSFRPGASNDRVTFLKPVVAKARPEMTPVLPVDDWGGHNFMKDVVAPRLYQYISLDRTTFIPAGQDFIDGKLTWGVKMADVLRAFGLAKAVPDQLFYVSDEAEEKTYSGMVNAAGTLTNLKLFAERGGESVAQDRDGNVYLAAGNLLVYDKNGNRIGEIDVPERPIDLVFGGTDGKTLFILAHHTIYAIDTRYGR